MTTEERLLQEIKVDKMRSRVTILVPSSTIDSYGNKILTFKEGDTVWAYVETHASEIYETTGEVHIVRKVLIVMRYRKDLVPDTRYKVDGNVYEATGAPMDACGRHKLSYVECVAELRDF